MRIAILLRGFHFLRADRFGYPLDARAYADDFKRDVIEPLRREHEVTVFAATYPSPIQAELFATLGITRSLILDSATSQQAPTYARGLDLIAAEPEPFDRVICLRFDLRFLVPVDRWRIWDRRGIFFLWCQRPETWPVEMRTGDAVHVVDREWFETFHRAVTGHTPHHDLHSLYLFLRPHAERMFFLIEGFWRSNTLFARWDFRNPLYRIINRPCLPCGPVVQMPGTDYGRFTKLHLRWAWFLIRTSAKWRQVAMRRRRIKPAGVSEPARIVIFGASVGGQRARRVLRCDERVIAFCDNDRAKHGQQLGGVPIIAPDHLRSTQYDRVLIASSYHREIRAQLRDQLGVDGAKIEVLDGATLRAVGEPLRSDYAIAIGLIALALAPVAALGWWLAR